MARIPITGSSGGLGLMAGQLLIEEGHDVVLHARTADRDPGIADVVVGDFGSLAGVRSVAEQAEGLGPFDLAQGHVRDTSVPSSRTGCGPGWR